MNITFRHAIEHVLTLTGDYDGFLGDDFFASKKAVNDMIVQIRAALVTRLGGDTHMFSAGMYQPISCIPMQRLDQQACPCAPASGRYWLRSRDPLPVPLITQSVSDTLGLKPFNHIAWEQAGGIPQKRRASARRARYYTWKNAAGDQAGMAYLYLYNDQVLQECAVNAIFSDPQRAEVLRVQCAGGSGWRPECAPLDVPLYLDEGFHEELYAMMLRRLWPHRAQAHPSLERGSEDQN